MTRASPPDLDSPQRICEILSHMREALQQSITEIERIAAREVLRHGDDTLEGLAWCDFGDGLHGDVARAARAIQWEIAALRGELIYRGLLPSPQSAAPGDEGR
jgi:hypothetical protein